MYSALLVEPDELDRNVLTEALSQAGYQVHSVKTGSQALADYDGVRPDLLICSLDLADMDGIVLAGMLQERHGPSWLPAMLLARSDEEEERARSFEAGADAFLVKPVSARVISARVQALSRILERQRREQTRAEELARYRAYEEEDKRIAMHLMEKLVNREKLRDAALSYWIQPAASFSGDVIAAARTPNNVLHVLLADGTGHGLSASLNVLPITAPFYRMTERGFGIDSIVRELNAKVRDLLPRDRFIAATLAAVNFAERSIHVWNGGNPPPFLLLGSGATAVPFGRRHLPLGVLATDEFDAGLETRQLPASGQLLMYSDGLVEAEDAGGAGFGRARMQTALVGRRLDEKLDCLRLAVQQHVGAKGAHDDISVLLVDCAAEPAASAPARQAPPRVVHPANAGTWKVQVALSAAELRRVDVVPLLLGLISQLEVSDEHAGQLFAILSEMFNNALDHGVLGLDSVLKSGADGLAAYYEERARRLAGLGDGRVEVELRRGLLDGTPVLEIRVADSGRGFDHELVMARAIDAACHDDEQPYGRGLLLLRHLCRSVDFLQDGREVLVKYALAGPAAQSAAAVPSDAGTALPLPI